jgi:hypothetical protein
MDINHNGWNFTPRRLIAVYRSLGSEKYQHILLKQVLELESKLIQSVQGKTVNTNLIDTSDLKVTKRQRRRGKTISRLAGSMSIETLEQVTLLKKQLLDIQRGTDILELHLMNNEKIHFTTDHLTMLQTIFSNSIVTNSKSSIINFAKLIVLNHNEFHTRKIMLKSHLSITMENPNMNQNPFLDCCRNLLKNNVDYNSMLIYNGLEIINFELNLLIVKINNVHTQIYTPSKTSQLYICLTVGWNLIIFKLILIMMFALI